MKLISTKAFSWKTSVFLVLCMLVQLFQAAAIPGAAIPKASAETNFAHPGGWVTAEDITLVRSKLAASEQPWVKANNSLLASGPNADYQPQPVPVVTREVGGTSPDGSDMKLRRDASNAYTLMIKWVATGDLGYAQAAVRIIDAWSSTLVEFKGFDDRLAAAIYGNKLAQAAELAAYAVPDWPNKPRAQAMFRDVFYPLLKNGAKANWGTTAMACIISMGVFLDDQAMFDQAVTAFKAGFPNLRHFAGVTEYIDETGQNAESGRDQGHSQSGVAHLVETAAVAYNQGINLFAYSNNRLLLGMEYLAKYNLGYEVPYHPFITIDGPLYPDGISSKVRGGYQPIYEMANNYFTAAGVTGSVYTQQVIQSSRYAPEKTHFDHPGFGTLIFTVVPLRASQPAPQISDIPAGAYKLKNPNSGKFLEAAGAGTEDGTPVQINPDSSIANQKWIITPSGDGTYQIVDSNSQKALTVSESTDNGAAVHLSAKAGGLNQKWTIDELGNGTYKFVSASNHKALHVAGNGKAGSTPVQQWEDNGFYGQRWQLITDNEAPTPPTNLKANAVSDELINLSWTASTDNVGVAFYAVYRNGVQVGTTKTTAYTHSGLLAETSYSYTVKAVDNLLNYSAASSTAAAATAANILFMSSDIGPVGLAGSYSYYNGKHTVTGSGRDIWSAEDQFNFVYIPVNGDITVTASVYSQQNTHIWAKAGIMMRATLDANSPYAMLNITPGTGIIFQWRSSSGASTKQTVIAMQTVPVWLKLVRTGALIEGYYSIDGISWTTAGSANVPAIPDTMHVGLNVTSHNNTKLSTVVIDHVSITGPHIPESPLPPESAGESGRSTAIANDSAATDNTTAAVNPNGNDAIASEDEQEVTSVTVEAESMAKTDTSGQYPVVELNNTGPAVQTDTITNVTGESQEVVNASVTEQGAVLLPDNPIDVKTSLNDKDVSELHGKYAAQALTLNNSVDPSKATAVWIDADNRMHFIPSVFSDNNRVVTIYSPYERKYTVIQNDISFPDLQGHWAKADVELLANKLIVYGVSNDAFDPDNQITRAEFAALLVRSLGLNAVDSVLPFTDVETADWYAGDVGAAQKWGLIEGYEDGSFKPGASITREQMVVMIMRAIKIAGKEAKTDMEQTYRFADHSELAAWAKDAAAQAVSANIIKGMTDTTFAAKDTATRAQSASMVKRMLQYLQFIN